MTVRRMQFERRDVMLWVALSLGPLAWFALLALAYWWTPGAHELGRTTLLRATAGVAAVFPIVSALLSVREMKLSRGDQNEATLQRRRFLALGAFVFSVLFLLLILGTAVPMFMLGPGAEP